MYCDLRMPAKQGNLAKRFGEDDEHTEIGVDEAGRGPMLGRVYSAAVVLPKEGDYRHELMKDSKRFTSDRKIREVASYIKEHALAWGVGDGRRRPRSSCASAHVLARLLSDAPANVHLGVPFGVGHVDA